MKMLAECNNRQWRTTTVAKNDAKGTVELVDPFDCRMWEWHDRLQEYVDENTCRDVIESLSREGQKHPVLARPARDRAAKFELIYGARRLFAARHLNQKLLARVREIDDREAFIEMDIENRLRRDISPYERGMSFRSWLLGGHFRSQEEIARTLGLSTAQVSRLMKFSELPTAIVNAFGDPRQIRESWAVVLAERCAEPASRERLLAAGRSLSHAETRLDAKEVFRRLLNLSRPGAGAGAVPRSSGRDQIVRSPEGQPLFKISYRHRDLHVIIGRDIASVIVVREMTEALQTILLTMNSNGGPKLARAARRSGSVRHVPSCGEAVDLTHSNTSAVQSPTLGPDLGADADDARGFLERWSRDLLGREGRSGRESRPARGTEDRAQRENGELQATASQLGRDT
jgi:ParB family chromosome partitioning protein